MFFIAKVCLQIWSRQARERRRCRLPLHLFLQLNNRTLSSTILASDGVQSK